MENTEKFSGRSAVYSAARPYYSDELFDMLANDYGFSGREIADIGSGTGIFSEGLLRRGNRVYAVEPNDEMRMHAEKVLGADKNFISVRGDSSCTNLQSSSVYAVTAAQAFHWFDGVAFMKECRRILYGKYIVLAYNMRTDDYLHGAVAEVNRELCPEFKGFQGGITTQKISDFFGGKYETKSFANDLIMDEDTFVKRNLSSSYAPVAGNANYDEYIRRIKDVFKRFSDGGYLKYPLMSVAYIGAIR